MAAGLYPFDNGSGWPTTKAGLDFLIRPEAPQRGYMNPALWAIREMQQSNLTVLRVFGTGADSTFAFVTEPGTAGADGTTWPDGAFIPAYSRCVELASVRLMCDLGSQP